MAATARSSILLAVLVVAVGASAYGVWRFLQFPTAKYAEQISSARSLSTDVRKFESLFPSARPHISHSTGEAGPTSWWCEFDSPEIEITATAPLEVDPKSRSVTQVGALQVSVAWIQGTEQLSDGRKRITYSGQENLSLADLDQLLGSESSEDARVRVLVTRRHHD